VVTGIPPVAVTATVWRHAQGRRFKVRGGVRRSVAGGLVVVDPEVPLDVQVSYVTEIFDTAGGSLGFLSAEEILVPSHGLVWVQNVLAPSRAIVYRPLADAFGHLLRSTPTGLYTPEGMGLPRATYGTRSGLQDVNLSGFTGTLEEGAALDAMLGDPYDPGDGTVPILVFRAPSMYPIPGTFIASVERSDAWVRNRSSGGQKRTWDLVGTEVEPPFPGLAEPVLTWDDVAAAYAAGWDQLPAHYAGWLEVSRDYSLARFAD